MSLCHLVNCSLIYVYMFSYYGPSGKLGSGRKQNTAEAGATLLHIP